MDRGRPERASGRKRAVGYVGESLEIQRLTGQSLVDLKSRLLDVGKPVLIGYGSPEFSTSHGLEPYPSVIYDCNAYYSQLGVGVRATRKEIRESYQRLDGENSPRLTMIIGVLLNPKRRHRYDLTPLGSLFLDDELIDSMRNEAALRASEVRAEGHEFDSDSFQEMIDQVLRDADESEEQSLRSINGVYNWSYYLWNTTFTDVDRLTQWRTLLAKNIWDLVKTPISLGVGFVSGDEDFKIHTVGFRLVVFLNEKVPPSDVIAYRAASDIVNLASPNQ